MRIGFDLDGVLALADAEILRRLHAAGLCQDIKVLNPTHFYLEECLPGVTQGLLEELCFHKPGYFGGLQPCSYLTALVAELVSLDHEVHIVTARPNFDYTLEETRNWLKSLGLNYHRLAICQAVNKHTYVLDHGLQLFVEDRFDTANRIAQLVPVLLVAMSYNTPSEHGRGPLIPGVIRTPRHQVASWVKPLANAIAAKRRG
jgi:uncharacterized HAD superfamily protein